jgi:hypothetical protein
MSSLVSRYATSNTFRFFLNKGGNGYLLVVRTRVIRLAESPFAVNASFGNDVGCPTVKTNSPLVEVVDGWKKNVGITDCFSNYSLCRVEQTLQQIFWRYGRNVLYIRQL